MASEDRELSPAEREAMKAAKLAEWEKGYFDHDPSGREIRSYNQAVERGFHAGVAYAEQQRREPSANFHQVPAVPEMHVDLMATDPLGTAPDRLVKRLPPYSSEIGRAVRDGSATYCYVSEPHTMAECPFAEQRHVEQQAQTVARNGEPCDCQTPGDWHRVANDFQRAMFAERRQKAKLREQLANLADLHHRTIASSRLHDPEHIEDWHQCPARSCRAVAAALAATPEDV